MSLVPKRETEDERKLKIENEENSPSMIKTQMTHRGQLLCVLQPLPINGWNIFFVLLFWTRFAVFRHVFVDKSGGLSIKWPILNYPTSTRMQYHFWIFLNIFFDTLRYIKGIRTISNATLHFLIKNSSDLKSCIWYQPMVSNWFPYFFWTSLFFFICLFVSLFFIQWLQKPALLWTEKETGSGKVWKPIIGIPSKRQLGYDIALGQVKKNDFQFLSIPRFFRFCHKKINL